VTTRDSGPKDRTMRPRGARPGGRGRFIPKRKVCFYCANKNEVIDYKNVEKLRSYLSDRAKIDPRRRTGTCAKHQRALATAIKRARHLALLPFVPEHFFPMPPMSALRMQPAAQNVTPAAAAPAVTTPVVPAAPVATAEPTVSPDAAPKN
jgi:small subunit ribosomal protein S18